MAKINKHAMYDAIARHTQAYPLNANGTAWTVAERVAEIMLIKAQTDIEIEAINNAIAAQEASEQAAIDAENLQALKPIWEAELIAEQAGFNRTDVIAELQANIASVPV